MRATRALIHLEAFRRNIGLVRDLVGAGRKLCVPVKAGGMVTGRLKWPEPPWKQALLFWR